MNKSIFYCVAFLIIYIFTVHAANAAILITNRDASGEGFNDLTSVEPIFGNSGTTLGEQRLNVFRAAAGFWADYLNNSVPIIIDASMDPLDCGSRSGTLGGAGPTTAFRDFSNSPQPLTWYPAALANELAGTDLNGTSAEISSVFNSSIDNNDACLTGTNWWYGIGGSSPSGTVSFYDTVLHEIAHGLGFITFVNQNGQLLFHLNDHFMVHLMDKSTNKKWSSMNDFERMISSINNQLVWTGSKVKAISSVLSSGQTTDGFVHMYAPNPFEGGSSVSHWDVSLEPNELMEPFSTLSSISTLTEKFFCDIGWPVSGCDSTTTPEPEGSSPVVDDQGKPFIKKWLNILLPATQQANQ